LSILVCMTAAMFPTVFGMSTSLVDTCLAFLGGHSKASRQYTWLSLPYYTASHPHRLGQRVLDHKYGCLSPVATVSVPASADMPAHSRAVDGRIS
jgi:hypothetical protein